MPSRRRATHKKAVMNLRQLSQCLASLPDDLIFLLSNNINTHGSVTRADVLLRPPTSGRSLGVGACVIVFEGGAHCIKTRSQPANPHSPGVAFVGYTNHPDQSFWATLGISIHKTLRTVQTRSQLSVLCRVVGPRTAPLKMARWLAHFTAVNAMNPRRDRGPPDGPLGLSSGHEAMGTAVPNSGMAQNESHQL